MSKKIKEKGIIELIKYDDGSIEILPKIEIQDLESDEVSEFITACHLVSGYLSLHLNVFEDELKKGYFGFNVENKVLNLKEKNKLNLIIDNDKKK